MSGIQYKIVRSIRPNALRIWKNGAEQDGLSTRDLTQDEIDKIIGIDYGMFRQVISLAMNYNRAFLTLSSMEKRAIVESVFNIKLIGEMLKNVKKRIATTRMDYETKRGTLTYLEADIKSSRKRAREMTTAVQNFERDRARDLSRVQQADIKNRADEERAQKSIAKAQQQLAHIGEIDDKRHRDLIALLKQRIEVDRALIKQKEQQEEVMRSYVCCPICRRAMTEKHREREMQTIAQYKERLTQRIAKEEQRMLRVQHEVERLQLLQIRAADCTQTIAKENSHLQWTSERSKEIVQELARVQTRRSELVDIEKLTAELDTRSQEYKAMYADSKTLHKQLRTYEIVANILSDSGIKAYFFQKLLPVLNQKVNENLARFNISLHLEFNDLMEERITAIDSSREISYWSCSEGEKKRIDVCVLLAFIDVAKLICNWNCNLILFDELFDVHLDEEGLETIVSSLQMMKQADPSLCIYVVSFRLHDNTAIFDNVLYAAKKNDFSHLLAMS